VSIIASLVIGVTANTVQAESAFRRMRGQVSALDVTARGFNVLGKSLGWVAAAETGARAMRDLAGALADARVAGKGWGESMLDAVKALEELPIVGALVKGTRYQLGGGLLGDILTAITGKDWRSAAAGRKGEQPSAKAGAFRQVTALTLGAGGDTQAARQTTLLQQIANNTRSARAS
jgi:hypothetical protein